MSQSISPTVIVGAGFVGAFVALYLNHFRYPAPVILIERNDRFCFKPLLYEYLSGELRANQVVPAFADLLEGSSITFVQEAAIAIDLNERQVVTNSTAYSYGNLVLALGSVPAFFAQGAEANALTFQSKADADRLRDRLHQNLQQAKQTSDRAERRRLLTTVIVGGGPAGVELSMTLGDLLPQWWGDDPAEMQIILLNHGDILSGDVNSHLRDTAKRSFAERTVPVDLRIGASVTAVHADGVEYTIGDQAMQLAAGAVVWTAGTAVNPLIAALTVPPEQRTRRGLLHVTPTLQLPAYPEVFAAGDCTMVTVNGQEQPLPSTAQVAYQQGHTIAHNLKAQFNGQSLQPAHVTLRGTLMKLGFDTAVANIFDRYEIMGKAGQIIREGTYLALLPTPIHDFKMSEEWLSEELFRRHTQTV